MAGTLYTYGATITLTAAEFQSYDTIAFSPDDLTSEVTLALSAPGTVDLTSQLSGRAVTFTGSSEADTITTSDGNDTVRGGAGDDILSGGPSQAGGRNTLYGGAGNDTFIGGSGANRFFAGDAPSDGSSPPTDFDTVTYASSTVRISAYLALGGGTVGNNEEVLDYYNGISRIIGSNYNDYIVGGADWAVVVGGGGADELLGLDSPGAVGTVSYFNSSDGVNVALDGSVSSGGDAEGDRVSNFKNMVGSDFDDHLVGNNFSNLIEGGDGKDLLEGGAGNDTLRGGDGDDTLIGGTGADAFYGDAGFDTVSYAGSGYTVANLATGVGTGGDTFNGIEALIGGDNGNVFTGNAAANRLQGGKGNDTLSGGAGADVLVGGDGFDTASYAQSAVGVSVNLSSGYGFRGDAEGDRLYGIDALTGSEQADTLIGNNDANTLRGLGGADLIRGYGGDDTLVGGAAADTLDGGEGIDTADYTGSSAVTINLTTGTGTGGNAQGDSLTAIENIIGTEQGDTLIGSEGDNRLDGVSGKDTLDGRGGNDTLVAGLGIKSILGGSGIDTAEFHSEVTVNLATGTGTLSGGTFTIGGVENLTAAGYSTLIGDDADNVLIGNGPLYGAGGNDRLVGSGTLNGGAGADQLVGTSLTAKANYVGSALGVTVNLATGTGSGGDAEGDTLTGIVSIDGSLNDDVLIGSAVANKFSASAGNDLIRGGAGADVINGGEGIDTADYSTSAAPVTVGLYGKIGEGGDAEGDSLLSIENLNGSAFADRLTGSTADNIIRGGAGADAMTGGGGRDTLDYATSAIGVTVDLESGFGYRGDAEGDRFTGFRAVIGSNKNDVLLGWSATNRLDGGAGDDRLAGRQGADELIGGAGSDTADYSSSASYVRVNLATGLGQYGDAEGDTLATIENIDGSAFGDTLVGNGASNRLAGGLGMDTLTGGGSGDRFVFNTAPGATNVDTITDFATGIDLIELSKAIYTTLQSGSSTNSLAPSAFRYSTAPSTSGGLGEVIYNAATGSLAYDSDGAGGTAAQQFAQVSTGLSLSAASFRLV